MIRENDHRPHAAAAGTGYLSAVINVLHKKQVIDYRRDKLEGGTHVVKTKGMASRVFWWAR